MGEEYLDYLVNDLEYSNLYLLFLKIIDDVNRGVFRDIYPKVNDIRKMKRRSLEDNKEISNTLDLFVKEIYEKNWHRRKIVGVESEDKAHEVHITHETKNSKYVFIFMAISNYRILCNYFTWSEYKNIKDDYLIPRPKNINIEAFSSWYDNRFIINSYKAFLSYCEECGHNPNRRVNIDFYGFFKNSLNYIDNLDNILTNKDMFVIPNYSSKGQYTFILYDDLIFLTHYSGEEEKEEEYEFFPEDVGRGGGSCAFCGGSTYGDVVCPSCANNID